jgi:hypothetical protein
MAETVQGLIDSVKNEGSFDVTDAQAVAWLNRRHERMIIRARAYRKTTTLTTVASQRDYTLPTDMVEVLEVAVDGAPYGRAHHTDLLYGSQGWVQLSGIGGVVASEESRRAGRRSRCIRLRLRTRVVGDSPGDVPPVGSERVGQLDAGGAVGVHRRADLGCDRDGAEAGGEPPGSWRRHTSRTTTDACEEFRRQVARRYRGAGPTPIRIQGVNV